MNFLNNYQPRRCVMLRNGQSIWIDQDEASELSDYLVSLPSSDTDETVMVGDEFVTIGDISCILPLETIAENVAKGNIELDDV